jgi:predicted alpha/beta superfamily hydrolase
MKKLLLPLFLSLLISCEKEQLNTGPESKKVFTILSTEKGKTYEIRVYLPADYLKSSEYYPTIYVLDADENEKTVASECKKASESLNTKNAIVIGINYGDDRNTDYTPTETDFGNGGSEAFLNFIKKELIPRIEKDYRADPQRKSRAILGHSFGGLFGAFAFTKHNEVFGNYLLLSSSLFYDHSVVLQYEQQSRPAIKDNDQLVFIGAGSTEDALLPANDLLYQRLKSYYPNTKTTFNIIPGRGHQSSKNFDIEDAIHFYFSNK